MYLLPPKSFYHFHLTIQPPFNGTSKYELKFYLGQSGINSMKIKASNNYTSTIDAWGAITTPSNANVNSLRQKYREISTDSTFIKPTGQPWMLNPSSQANPNPSVDTTYTYRWWSNTKKFPIAEITADASNVVTNASYLLSTLVGVEEKSIAKNDVNVFPNPASDKINITGITTESYLVIFDVNGKLMERGRLKKSNSSINTSEYQNGIYFYQITGLNGNQIGKGKFVVSK